MPERDNKGRWKKGQSGNPNGRPRKGNALTELLRAVGDEQTGGIPNKILVAREVWQQAINGEIPAIRLIYDRCEGLAHQSVDIDQTIVFEWSDDWDEDTTEVETTADGN